MEDERATLLTVLRDQCDKTSVKDGCAPQGQCGCCTVLIDGQARVSCVTPVRRIAGRVITTLEGLPPDERDAWADAFVSTGGSQCGFCTPGIICRFSALRAQGIDATDDTKLDNPLAAHLCRCTGWQTIEEAFDAFGTQRTIDPDAAARRANIEGGAEQQVGRSVALGQGGFAADTAPAGALVAVPDGSGGWMVGETLAEVRARSGKVQGRRTTAAADAPIPVPDGDWDITLQTSWVEPAHLETEVSWCEPGGSPSSPLANGGAFGAKVDSDVSEMAQRLANEHGRAVKVVLSREDSVRIGAKRPPIAAGINADGTGRITVVRTPGISDAITTVAPGLAVDEVDVPGPPTSTSLRGAGWVEAAVLLAAARDEAEIVGPSGGRASAVFDGERLLVTVEAGEPLDEVVLRSYCIGAAHMAYSWVTSEQLHVDAEGEIHDLTIRSFGIVRAADTPPIEITITDSGAAPVNGSDAVFAAVALATWRQSGFASSWPTAIASISTIPPRGRASTAKAARAGRVSPKQSM
ncbi:MAG: molybdopterin-dependent oxidoreductase [Acidimicrobiales bacterium]|nr:molybdopterin-dependent oxidoreductase [Acidimicrobiales bacterium]RZV42420.1 MAG: hypothetical protein EX269_14870 [Acidimicrobiales bacterium]